MRKTNRESKTQREAKKRAAGEDINVREQREGEMEERIEGKRKREKKNRRRKEIESEQ